MAGADPTGNFDAGDFRAQILQTMVMGLPNTLPAQPTFRWEVEGSYPPITSPTDQSGVPYDANATAGSPAPMSIADLQIECGVQYMGAPEAGTIAGFENATQIKVTLLDTQYDQLLANGGNTLPDMVVINNQIYNIDRAEVVGLFTVDVWSFYCTAQGEGA